MAAEAVAKIEKSIQSMWVTSLRIPKLESAEGRDSGKAYWPSPHSAWGRQGCLCQFWLCSPPDELSFVISAACLFCNLIQETQAALTVQPYLLGPIF